MPLIRGIARTAVVAGTATAVSNRVSRRQQTRWAEQANQGPMGQPQQQYAAPPPATPAPAQDSTINQLKELADLRQQGILTEDEFAAQKAKILAG